MVRLDSGSIIKRPLVGLDPAAYESLRLSTALDQQQLAERARRLAQQRALIRHDSLATQRLAGELQSSRLDVQAINAALVKQQTLTSNALALPLRPPVLLDSHTYLGGVLGVSALLLVKVLLLH